MPPEIRRIPIHDNAAGGHVALESEWIHYLSRVLRLQAGDKVWGFCGDGYDYLYEITSITKGSAELKYLERKAVSTDPLRPLIVIIALPKSGKLDDVVKSGTALGLTDLLAFRAMRSEGKASSNMMDRLNKAALEAARQCGRTTLPTVHPLHKSLQETMVYFKENFPDAQGAMGEMQADLSLKDWNDGLDETTPRAWLVGPEGHLTPAEIEMARAAGFTLVNLGPRVLRTELAAVAGMALLA
jgi:16S rRNA (uracil1498-N3)-methyltransferase